jgi:hypothetical protein
VHFAQNASDGEGVGYIGFATAAELAFVSLFRVIVGAAYAVNLVAI